MRNKLTAEQRRQVKKDLMFNQDFAWQRAVPQYAGNDSSEVVTAKIKKAFDAFMAAAIDFQESDRKLLLTFVHNNNCDMTNPDVWFSAWQRISGRLGVQPEPEPEPEPTPAPASAPEPRNPFPVNSWDWHKREEEILQEDIFEELAAPFAECCDEIAIDGRHLREQERKLLFKTFAKQRRALSVDLLRSLAIRIWGGRVSMTPEEADALEMDDPKLSAEELAKRFANRAPRTEFRVT